MRLLPDQEMLTGQSSCLQQLISSFRMITILGGIVSMPISLLGFNSVRSCLIFE